MNCPFRARLDAFHDGELSAAGTRQLQRHLTECPACAAELEEIREVSRSFEGLTRAEPSERVLARAAEAAEAAADEAAETAEARSPVLWVTGALTGLAASVLIVASAWLWAQPGPPPDRGGRPPPRLAGGAPAPAAEWERVAMNLEAEPLPGEAPQSPQRQMLADAHVAEWILRNLGVAR